MTFSSSLEKFQNEKGKMVVVANTASKEKLAMEVVKLQVTVKNLTEKDPRKQVDNIAGKLRHEIKPSKSNISWHPLISKLSSENILPLNYLLPSPS